MWSGVALLVAPLFYIQLLLISFMRCILAEILLL